MPGFNVEIIRDDPDLSAVGHRLYRVGQYMADYPLDLPRIDPAGSRTSLISIEMETFSGRDNFSAYSEGCHPSGRYRSPVWRAARREELEERSLARLEAFLSREDFRTLILGMAIIFPGRVPEMAVRRLLKSWAIPPARMPMASNFCVRTSSSSTVCAG